eukprot:COSAG04_NODE_190_length_20948_cov_7.298863_11_plen_123_part_00
MAHSSGRGARSPPSATTRSAGKQRQPLVGGSMPHSAGVVQTWLTQPSPARGRSFRSQKSQRRSDTPGCALDGQQENSAVVLTEDGGEVLDEAWSGRRDEHRAAAQRGESVAHCGGQRHSRRW